MDVEKARAMIRDILASISDGEGNALVESFASLRDVDAKVREAKLLLDGIAILPASLRAEMDRDLDFSANSRRVRLEALANYLRTTLKFLASGVLDPVSTVEPVPDVSKITATMSQLDAAISTRWAEAQRCQRSGCHLAAMILMGSILEGLLLSRALADQPAAYRTNAAPRDRSGKTKPIHDWNLSALIDVAVELGWLKADRGKFSHALRESRNVVHPWQQVTLKADFDEATCRTSWEVLKASVSDLVASV
jgi:hypothetical protein